MVLNEILLKNQNPCNEWKHLSYYSLRIKCHETGSTAPNNPCNTNQIITKATDCPKQEEFGVYNPQYAYDLLRLSTIPYVDDQYRAVQFLGSHSLDDFEIVEWIGRHCEDLPLITYKECLAVVMISKRKKAIVLAYRGTTDSEQFWDEVQSVLITFKVPSDIGNGKVQGYFKKAHDKLYDCVVESMQAQISMYPNYEFWITGHSLWGAIASIASARLLYDGKIRKDKIALYTFGMPRVGDRQYALDHNRLVNNSWRVIHRKDPVPHYPVSTGFSNGPFHHRTEVFYPSERMLPTDTNYVVFLGSDNDNCGSSFSLNGDIKDHKIYFDIPVGTFCQNVGRSTKSAMWNHFNDTTCSRLKNLVNRAMIGTGYDQTTMLLIVLTCVLFN